ncbi:L,D-transpeptidase [Paraburkholderia sp. LEh10]|uniref:L,D-transpeptidase n=1 Tax=Paraburkholderia sp. LEh10 TaxID=2821353 RepID=UPI003917C082
MFIPPARERVDLQDDGRRDCDGARWTIPHGTATRARRFASGAVRSLATSLVISLTLSLAVPASASNGFASDTPQDPASPAVDASAVAAHDAVGGADPRRALLMRDVFARSVTRRLNVPAAEQRAYGGRLQNALEQNDLGNLSGEYVVLVDRNENVQALFVYFRAVPVDTWQMIGASPVATGRPGQFDHFITPLGVFEHTPDNMDLRAEGTMNQNGIRGYGKHDMRIFDLGWAQGERGWGKGGMSQMRFQMHATDPDKLEPILGIRHSKGCVRIPASLNVFLDHYGILDREYEALVADGKSLWVLHSDRVATPWAGRYIAVVDSQRKARPAWSPVPSRQVRAKVPANADTAD